MSSIHSEIFEQYERRVGSPPTASTAGEEAYQRLLRAFLTSQIAFERAQNLRQTVLFVLTAMSLARTAAPLGSIDGSRHLVPVVRRGPLHVDRRVPVGSPFERRASPSTCNGIAHYKDGAEEGNP